MVILNKADVTTFELEFPAHACLTDPPYELSMMSKSWDRTGVSFRVSTWEKVLSQLYPGAFSFAFSSSKLDHRMRVAIEDAGATMHPTVWQWAVGNRMTKAKNLKDEEGKAIGYAYGQQTLANVIEPIACFQKPYDQDAMESIEKYGSGTLWIDGGRIGGELPESTTAPGYASMMRKNKEQGYRPKDYYESQDGFEYTPNPLGRHPKNLLLQHLPGCLCVGEETESYTINRFDDGAKPFGDAVGEKYTSSTQQNTSLIWECAEGCPVKKMNDTYGIKKSGLMTPDHGGESEWGYSGGKRDKVTLTPTYADSGYVSRFYHQTHWAYDIFERLENADPIIYEPKASIKEKSAGCGTNPHISVKPIELCRYLAALLLPQPQFSPRRLYVPFCGSGSEIIGGLLAGWEEVIGVDIDSDDTYLPVARARIDFWEWAINYYGQLPPREILRLTQKKRANSVKSDRLSLF